MNKKKKEIILKLIAGMLAVLVFLGLVSGAKEFDKGVDTTYEIVFLGDSNIGNYQDETGIVAKLEKRLGKPVLNGGFGGSTMSCIYREKTEYSVALSMYQLAASISNKNFGVQKSAIDVLNRTNGLGYFENTVEKLAKVDFDNVKILIIEHGVNDYLSGVTIENGRNPDDVNTFKGAVKEIITILQREYPNMRIILVTPSYCAPYAESEGYRNCEMYDYGGGYLEDYVNAEIEVAKEMNVEVIDLYHEMGIDGDNFLEYFMDGLHYTEETRDIVADIIADYILGETE